MDRALVSALVAFAALFALGVTSVLALGRAHEARMSATLEEAEARDDGGGGGRRGQARADGGGRARRRRGRGEDANGDADAMRARAEAEAEAEAAAQREQRGLTWKEQKEEKYRRKWAELEARDRAEMEAAAAARAERRRLEDKAFGIRRGLFGGREASSAAETSADESPEALVAFADEIKAKKVVVLEELAAKFGLRTADAERRVRMLEAEGRITGITDDRGTFIYVSREEMERVAAFIAEKGRVQITELTRESAEILGLCLE